MRLADRAKVRSITWRIGLTTNPVSVLIISYGRGRRVGNSRVLTIQARR